MKWNLDDLYTEFNDKFAADILKVKNLVDEFNNLELKGNVLVEYINIQEELTKTVKTLAGYCSLRTSTNVADTEAIMKMSMIRNMLNEMTLKEVKFSRYLLTIKDLEKVIENNNLNKYKYIILRMKESASRLLSEQEEVLYSKMKMVASDSWNTVQKLLTSNLTTQLDGQEVTLSFIRNLAYENKQELRKEAYFKELEAYKKVEDTLAIALSNIKREVSFLSELRGYNSVLEKTLDSSKMKKETLDAMLEAMKESLPSFRDYFKAKAVYLDHKKGLPFYDLFAPIGSLDKNYTYEEAKEVIITNFNSFSSKLGSFAKKAFDNNWIDVEPYKGKVGGAFCSNQTQLKQSRILLNYTGSLSDVSTLAHELGHGYHGDVICNADVLNTSYPMPLAETASILCETIVMNNLMNTLTDENELFSVLEISLQGDSQVIVDIMSRYIFETNLIENTKDKTLNAKQLNEMMIEAQKETYGDGLDEEFMHPYMWACKGHYYSAGLNFYNFPYAFGLLYAKGLYAMYLEDKESFVSKYDDMLMLTGSASVEDVAKSMGIDVTKKEFWINSLEIIKKDINKFISLSKKLK
ncbi:MAG: M3 family oligoendopeptidase [bacterium]